MDRQMDRDTCVSDFACRWAILFELRSNEELTEHDEEAVDNETLKHIRGSKIFAS